VSGWKIKGSNSSGAVTTRLTITSATSIPARGHFLATNSSSSGYSGSVAGNQTYTSGITDDGGIAITDPSDAISDQVGMSTGSTFKEGTVLTPLTTNTNQSYERKPGGSLGSTQDTNNNANDFALINPSDPQNLSSPPTPVPSPTPTPTATPTPVPISRVDVTPTNPTINRGNQQQFSATAFDTNNQPVPSATFTWTSSNTAVATINASSGLATGVGIGTTTMTATTADGLGGNISGTATLNVQVPLIINEILADPPGSSSMDLAGDSNRDGVRDGDDDEFVELLNNSNAAVDISGVIVADATSNRFTFPANTILAAGRAVVIFGGGTPPVNDPAFGGALIETTSSLSLNNTSDTVNVKLVVSASDVLIATQTYGAEGGNDQSLTRSPDAEVGSTGGSFVAHNTATNASGRVFSPGTRADGTPFGSPAITRVEVTPASSARDIGGAQTYTGKAFINVGGHEVEVANVCFIWDSSDTSKATVAPLTGQITTATAVAPGSPTIRARAGGQQDTATFTINSPPPVLTSVTISPASVAIANGDSQLFTGQALDQFSQPIGGVTVTFSSNNLSVATVDSTSATSGTDSATGTVGSHATGSAQITATATDGVNSVNSAPATLTVEPAAGQLLISEFRTRGPSGASDEFVEVYNPTTSTQVIGGLKIRASNSSASISDRVTITAGTTLGPGCHYLVANSSASGYSGATPANQTYTTGITDDGGIAITGSTVTRVIDAVGMSSGSAYKEGTTLTSLAGTANQSYERKPGGASGNGTDTNVNSADFFLNSGTSNPQNSSSGCLDTTRADLSVSNSDTPDPVTVNSDITYTITVANNGIGAASNVVVTDNLPSSLTFVSCISTGGGVCGGSGNNRSVTYSSLAVGATAKITIVGTVNGTGGASISNTASVGSATTDPNNTNDSAIATTTISSADLSITKTDSPDPVNAGENITYTIVVTNNSATIPAENVTVSDPLPANTTLVSVGAAPAGWTRTDPTAVGATGTITYTKTTLTASNTATFTIIVKVDSGAANNSTISNTASVSCNTPDDTPANNSAPTTTAVRTPADLSLTKTVSNAAPNVSESVTFTIVISNAGPFAATSVTVKDSLPAGLTYLSDDGGGSYANGTGIWSVGTVNSSASKTLHVIATVTSTAVSGVTNTAEVTASDQFDPDSTPNNHNASEDDQASATVTAQSADLSLTKTVDNPSSSVGQNVTFTITASNAGPNAATNVSVKDSLPAGLTYVSDDGGGAYNSASGVWTIGTVNALSSATLHITATVAMTGTITNTAEIAASDVFDPDSTPNNHNAGEDDRASAIVSSLQADLSLTKSVDNPTPDVGSNVTFTLTVNNAGPDAAPNVAVKDLLPAGLTYVSDDGAGAYASATGVWTIGPVAAAGSATLHITATATSASINGVTNTAEITASGVPDLDSTPNNHNALEDDQASVTVNAKDADLSITKTDSPDPVLAGNNITYTIDVKNNGPDASLNLTLSDSVPANTTFQSLSSPVGWSCLTPSAGGTGSISCTLSSLPNGQTDSFTLVVKVNSGISGNAIISNTATASSSTTFDPVTPNSATATTTVQPVADLSISKADSPDPVLTGGDITYTITATNSGPDAATNATLADTIPTNTTFRSITPPAGWTCGTTPAIGGAGPISCTNPSFAVGSSVFTLVVRVNAGVADNTTISNTASISSSTFDPTTPNSATATTTARAPLIVISQVYGGGGNSGATYKNDFIEIFNRGGISVDLAGWSVQQAASTGTTWSVTQLCPSGPCLLAPGKYFLVQEASSGAVGANLPAPDATGTSNLSATAAKIALVNNITSLTGSGCPLAASVIDFVGYGTGTDCFEGTNHAGAPNNTTADFRKSGGCADTNDNLADFVTAAPNPRNNGSTANDCSTGFRPDISINDVTVSEGDSGTVNATFNVTLSAANNAQTVTVDFATADGTAIVGADYQSNSGTLTFNPGVTSQTITVLVNGDTLDEANETFFVNLTNAVNASILDAQGLGTINDNDPTPSLSINDLPNITEGDSGTSVINFTVNLSAASGQTVTVNFATADGTATAGSDYETTSGTLTFNPGETVKQIPVTIDADTGFEPDETFFVNLTLPVNATILDSQGQGTIKNDDASPNPAITIDDVTVTEGNSGTVSANFTVSLSLASTQTVTVNYATADGTAKQPSDYQSSSGTLTFNPGDLTKPVSVLVNGDTSNEAICETFVVNLTSPANASISDPQGQGSITDDDGTKLVISQLYGGGGNGSATYTNDFIEIFNRGNSAVSLNGLSVQYSPATGTTGNYSVTTLPNVSLQPGHYYLIQEASGGAVGVPLPVPDLNTGTIDLSASAGRVALVNGTTALSRTTCPGGSTILDFVGYGTTAICREGASTSDNAPGPSNNTTSVQRAQNACQDLNLNGPAGTGDFSVAAVNPRNTSTTANNCSCSTSYSSLLIFADESRRIFLARLSAGRSIFESEP
jgi:uncharacterized repeat protein (TIGR01451 family)